jgi:ATP-dependent DNA helicase RecQ
MECLRAYILRYFGDRSGNFCGNCSNCRQNFETVDILEYSKKILSCICRMRERYGVGMLVDILRGSRSRKIQDLRLDQLSTYGIMNEVPQSRIREIINYLVLNGYIILSDGEFPVAKLGASCKELLYSNQPVLMKVVTESKRVSKEERPGKLKLSQSIGGFDQRLFEKLKELRFRIAEENKVPAFVIFSDATLADMCKKKPVDQVDMLKVSGVGEIKLRRYGGDFLKLISEHNAAQGEIPAQGNTGLSIAELCAYVNHSFEPSEEAIPVSMLADKLNALLLQKCDIKLSSVKLAKFYEEKGLLQSETVGGKNSRTASAAGNAQGITTVDRINAEGNPYRQNLYGLSAQQWTAEHLEELLDSIE